MAGLSISKAWDETKAVLARDGKLLSTVALALVLLPQAVAGAIAPPKELSGQDPPSWVGIVAMIVAIVGIIGQIAIVRLALTRGLSVGEAIAHGARRFAWPLIAVLLLVIAAALLAVPLLIAVAGAEGVEAISRGQVVPSAGLVMLTLIVGALLVGARLQMIIPAASEEGGGPVRLIRRSWQLTAGHYWRLLGFLILVLIGALVILMTANVIGGLLARTVFGDIAPLSLGALLLALATAAIQAAFSVVITVMIARIYAQLAGGSVAEPSVPSSGS